MERRGRFDEVGIEGGMNGSVLRCQLLASRLLPGEMS